MTNFLFKPLNLFLMTNMSFLDDFTGSIDHIIMDFKNDSGGGDVMVETVIVILLNFFDGALETKRDKLI